MNRYSSDFETSTWEKGKTHVWAWANCNIETEEIQTGTNLKDFIEFAKKEKNAVFYLHNLKFDGEFIIYWLFMNGYEFVRKPEDARDNTFTALINSMGEFYNIVIFFKVGSKVKKATFLDSLKIIPFPVEDIPKYFGLDIKKLTIDYHAERNEDHQLTFQEIEYISNDVLIVARALKQIFAEGKIRMTQSSIALADYTDMLGYSRFKHFFPEMIYQIDKDIRRAYQGGFVYCNPIYEGKEVGAGTSIDINSLFAYCQRNFSMPYGDPLFFDGEYKKDVVYNLYIQMITCSFKLKPNKIPTIRIKDSMHFLPTEYITGTDGHIVCLILTNIDLKLFFDHYIVEDLKFECGWKFKGIQGIFNEYVDYWYNKKCEATVENNKGMRTIAKLRLCSLYGKFASSMEIQNKSPYIARDGAVHYKLEESEIVKGVYIPVSAFVTAYSRDLIIRTSQKIRDYSLKKYGKDLYYYSDTDSAHCGLSVEELKEICEIDDLKLGAFKVENTFKRARYVKPKCYIQELEDNKLKIVCSGLPKDCYSQVEWDNFKLGFSCNEKLVYSHVRGGVKLKKSTFTINEKYSRELLFNF